MEEIQTQAATVPVEIARLDASEGVLAEIERSAGAQVATSKEKIGKAEETKNKNISGGHEAGLYADIAMEATGLKAVATVIEGAAERMGDKTKPTASATAQENKPGVRTAAVQPRTIEDDIAGAKREPKVYRSEAESVDYSNMSIGTRGFLAGGFLAAQRSGKETGLVGGEIPNKAGKVEEKQAEQFTASVKNNLAAKLASEQAYDSVQIARAHQNGFKKPAAAPGGMGGPNLALGSGPSFSNSILSEPVQDDSWKTGAVS